MWFISCTPDAHFSLRGSLSPSPVCWDGHEWGQSVPIGLVQFERWSKSGCKQTKKKKGSELWCFVFLWDFCFIFILSTFVYYSHIWNRTLGADSSKQRQFGIYFFWRKPEWGGTGRIPVLVPSVPPRKNWPLSLCGVESIELPWEAQHNTGHTKVLFEQLPMAQRAFPLTLHVSHHFSCYTV